MQEAEGRRRSGVLFGAIGARGLQQGESAHDVGLHEGVGGPDGAVHMRFGGEIDDGAGPVFAQQPAHQRRVGDVAMHQQMARVIAQCGQVGRVAGVGQQVQVDHRLIAAGQPAQHEIRTDEAGAAGDENAHAPILRPACRPWG
ncbi:Uncharacterised protein [Bordetella pertussis]|nr:Uncharacterised protein [Bordetella pertussis]